MKHFTQSAETLLNKIRLYLALFIAGLTLSGLTAFPIKTELELSHGIIEQYQWNNRITEWLEEVYTGVSETGCQVSFHFLRYRLACLCPPCDSHFIHWSPS
jgi:hypothetical protein